MKFIENIKYICNSNCPFRFKIIIAAEQLLSSKKKKRGMWEHRAAVPSMQKRLHFEGINLIWSSVANCFKAYFGIFLADKYA